MLSLNILARVVSRYLGVPFTNERLARRQSIRVMCDDINGAGQVACPQIKSRVH